MNAPLSQASETSVLYVPELDLYGMPHKGLRLVFSRVLERLGNADLGDQVARAEVIGAVEESLWMLEQHIEHEERFIHAALERRRPGSAARLDGDHDEHERFIAELRHLCAAIVTSSEALPAIARKLYLRYAVFVAENLVHMDREEQVTQRFIDELFSLEEQQALEAELIASIPPNVMMAFLRYMVPAISRDERVKLLSGPQQALPADAFAGMLGMLKPTLSSADFDDLSGRLGVAA